MDRLSHSQILSLPHVDTPPCVSVYVPFNDGDDDKLFQARFLENLKLAKHSLKRVYTDHQAKSYLDELAQIQAPELLFEKGRSLILFVSPVLKGYLIVPELCPEKVVVADSFHIKPLTALLSGIQDIHFLNLHQHRAELFLISPVSADLKAVFLRGQASSNHESQEFDIYGGYSYLNAELPENGRESDWLSFVTQEILSSKTGIKTLHLGGDAEVVKKIRSLLPEDLLTESDLPVSNAQLNSDDIRNVALVLGRFQDKNYKSEKSKLLDRFRGSVTSQKCIGIVETIRALSAGSLESIFIRKSINTKGRVDWGSARIRLFNNESIPADELMDDCIEEALRQKLTVVILESNEAQDMGEIAGLKKRIGNEDINVRAFSELSA